MTPNEHESITTFITGLLSAMGVQNDGITVSELAGTTFFEIRSIDSSKLLGTAGETLYALNTIVKKSLEGKVNREARYTVDVNEYHLGKVKQLQENARTVAERVRTFKYDIDLPAMSPYERMVVHSFLKEMSDIETTSTGEGPLRHIVVRYKKPE